MTKNDLKIIEFLNESNAIEQEYDSCSLLRACQAWEYLSNIKRLDSGVINQAHQILMYDKGLGINCGNYRNAPVYILSGNGIAHVPPAPYMVPHLMSNWILDHGNKAKTSAEIKEAHIRYESIHPHIDGNGRLGRMLMNWQRQKAGLPILIIFEKKKAAYYEWFATE